MLTFDFSETQSTVLYNFFLLAALFAALTLYVREGKRRRFPMTTWLTVVAVVNVLLVVGSRLGAFSGPEWLAFLSGSAMPAHAQKTALGGLALGLVGYLFLRWRWRLPASVADVVFLGLPLAAMVGRVGCLAAGCCFGMPTDVPWAARFGPASSVFQWQAGTFLIPYDADFSLPVHPVQVYFIAGNLLIFSVLLLVRSRLKVAGSLALLALALMMTNRFFLEFFRAGITNRGLTGLELWGLKGAQWLALLLVLATSALFFRNEKRGTGQHTAPPGTLRGQPVLVLATWLAGLAVFAFLSRQWLTFVEEWLVLLSVAPAFASLVLEISRTWAGTAAVKFVPVGVLSATALVLVQLPRDSMAPSPRPVLLTGTRQPPARWWEIGGGGTFGQFKDIDRNCDGDIIREESYSNRSFGTEASHHWYKGGTELVAGLKLGGGSVHRKSTTSSISETRGNIVVGPFFKLEEKGIGLNLGFLYAPEALRSDFYQTDFSKKTYFSGGFRLGRRDRYFFDFQYYNQHSFSYFPYPSFSVGLFNLGFNDPSGRTLLRVGFAGMASSISATSTLRFPFGRSNLTGEFSAFLGTENMVSAGLRYRITQ